MTTSRPSRSRQGTLQTIRDKRLTKENFKLKPRHIVTEDVYVSSPGVVPELGDPSRDAYLDRQTLSRSSLGGGIWISHAYPQVTSGINSMCENMANPSDQRLGHLRARPSAVKAREEMNLLVS